MCGKKMKEIVLLKWSFEPKDYFGDEVPINREGYEMIINNGVVEAHINPSIYDEEHKLRDVLHKDLENRFLAAQVLKHKPFILSKSAMYRLHADGRMDTTVFPDSMTLGMAFGAPIVDVVVRNEEGNVVVDSYGDRVRRENRIFELISKNSDNDVVSALLKSYQFSIKDPDNELVHLYEIRDKLAKVFGGENEAKKILKLSSSKWSRLGALANDESLKQGRHRGKNIGGLRDATVNELSEARAIALSFLEAYLEYVD